MNKPKGFMCYCSWREALGKLPPTARLRVYDAIFEYVDTGNVPKLSVIEEVTFAFIKSDIDRALTKYKDRCEKNREIAQKREDEKRKARTNTNVRKYKEDDRDRDRDREKDEDKDKDDDKSINKNDLLYSKKETVIKEKDGDADASPTAHKRKKREEDVYDTDLYKERQQSLVQDDSRIGIFNKWLIQTAPYIVGHFEKLVTAEELEKLLAEYSSELISNTIFNLENDKKRRSGYANLYVTLSRNWLPIELQRWQQQQLTTQRLKI